MPKKKEDTIRFVDAIPKTKDFRVPLDVPKRSRKTYIDNYLKATKASGHLMLFAGDQRIEHLNKDFVGKGIHKDDADPEHFFRIASEGNIGVFATQLGLISHYGEDYKDIDYLVKLNSKTNIVPLKQADPYSEQITTVKQVIDFKKENKLNIVGVGYTMYLGSEHESKMLKKASQIIYEAHQEGLIVVLWIYPRGKALKDETSPETIAGATGVANCLGTDFTKVICPDKDAKQAITAAGRTKVIFSGGSSVKFEDFLKTLDKQLKIGASGNATGRNIHQKSLKEAKAMCNAIYALTVEGRTITEALKIYKK